MDPTIDSTGNLRFLPAQTGNAPVTMSSQEIAELCEKRHDHVMRDIRVMLEELGEALPKFGGTYSDSQGRVQTCFNLPKDLTLTLVAGYNIKLRKRIIDRWMELEANQFRLPTTAEAFASAFQMIADQERRQHDQERAIKAIDAKVALIEETNLLKAKPQNAESISEIRKRINRKYGLPPRIIDIVMAQTVNSPRPAGMVKNSHEDAQGSSYAVYWIRDVSQAFKLFVDECAMVTATQATHRLVDGRFKLTGKAGA